MFILIAAAVLLTALAYLPLSARPPSTLRSVIKTIPLLAFAQMGYLAGVGPFLVAGLFLSALGDFALSRDGQSAFLYGLSAFALAHLVYILHFFGLSGVPLWDAFVLAPIAAIALVALLVSTELWLAPHTGALCWPVRVYVVIIGAMGLAALILPFGFTVIGAGLFILSDLILAIQLFRMQKDHPLYRIAGYVLWIFYIAGQLYILAGGVVAIA